jgi:hypothetical protein
VQPYCKKNKTRPRVFILSTKEVVQVVPIKPTPLLHRLITINKKELKKLLRKRVRDNGELH